MLLVLLAPLVGLLLVLWLARWEDVVLGGKATTPERTVTRGEATRQTQDRAEVVVVNRRFTGPTRTHVTKVPCRGVRQGRSLAARKEQKPDPWRNHARVSGRSDRDPQRARR